MEQDEYLDKINPKDENKHLELFQKNKKLTNGFLRDYAVGMTSDYILHIDVDTVYQPKTLKRKLRFFKDLRLDCVYCKSIFCIYDLWKTIIQNRKSITYESTLFSYKIGKGG